MKELLKEINEKAEHYETSAGFDKWCIEIKQLEAILEKYVQDKKLSFPQLSK